MPQIPSPAPALSLRDAAKVWARIGLFSFGGPAGQIALMHQELVEKRKWIDEQRFMHALQYCMLLPGPEAQQLATYIGWLLHKTPGGLLAGTLFMLPGAVAVMLLSVGYAAFHQVPAVSAVFFGLKTAVLALVIEALLRIGKRSLHTWPLRGVATLAFLAIFFLEVPFPLIVLMAGLLGLVGARLWPLFFLTPAASESAGRAETVLQRMKQRGELGHTLPSVRRAIQVSVIGLTLWFAPLAALMLLLGPAHVLTREGIFFSQAAVVTFGGAYAVLSYVAQRAVETFGWLQPGEMLDGLGLAETTPGPLILVLQFVGFMGAYRNAGGIPPMLAGVLGALVTLWVTFVPCFLWIFLGAPFIEALRENKHLRAALAAVSAAVAGVIANLSLWFALHVLFGQVAEQQHAGIRMMIPVWSSLNFGALVLTALALVATFRLKMPAVKTLALSVGGGLALYLLQKGVGR